MAKYVIVLIGLMLCGMVQSQLLDNSKGLAFGEYPFFNTPFIKASKIKEIKGSYTFKKQGDVMRQTDYVYVFSFDESGQLIRHYETAKGDIVNDTVVRFYSYDGLGNLLSKRLNEKRGFMTTYFTYNDKNQIVKEEVWRDIDTLHSLLTPDIERSILWNSETMSYEEYGTQHKKRIYNSYGNQYVETSTYYDSLGYLSSTTDLYTITRDQYSTYYTYGNKGWVENVKFVHNIDSIPLTEFQFTYDQYGNLSSKKEYREGVFTTEYQIIYSGDTGMLSSVLIREIASNFISIIRFSEPTFWE